MKKKNYETPHTQHVEVELEEGIMTTASIYDPSNHQEEGVTIEGHEFGNSMDFSGDSWDSEGTTF